MKKIFLMLAVILITYFASGQNLWNLTFDDTAYMNRVWIDTISNPNNTWQIGTPGKIIFNGVRSIPHAIVTDTLHPYPVYDTSGFIITHLREPDGSGGNPILLLDFYFQMNSDTLTDHGIIEASIDHGITWINLMTQDTTYGFLWNWPKPVLSGNTNGWTHFSLNLAMLTPLVGFSDTLLYRFTFVSDGIQTDKEGWIIDDFTFEDFWEGIEEIKNDNLISVYPDPANDLIFIHTSKITRKQSVQIFNYTGQLVLECSDYNGEPINTQKFISGVYVVRYTNTKNYSVKRFVVQH